VGVKDHQVLRGVKEDKEKMKFHMACNRYVFLRSVIILLLAFPALELKR